METKPAQRRYDLDWLRVMAFSGVFFYHCSRFFNSAGWHIKNAQTSQLLDMFTGIFDLFGMPLIFAISGASVFFALHPGQAGRFLRERVLRLLVPLGLGILVLAPPQVYLDRLTHGEFSGSFFEFIPHFFQADNFAWFGVHLWYLEYLFVFTLLLLPLFIWLRLPSGQRALDFLSRISRPSGAIYLWVVPTALVTMLLDPFSLLEASPSEALARLVLYPLPFIYGYLIYADGGIQQAIIRQRRTSLVIALLATLSAPLISLGITQWGWKITLPFFTIVMLLASHLIWSYLLAAFGYAMRYLTFNKRLLTYANEAVLPVYILHQPVILLLGYFIIPLQMPILVKYLIITPSAWCLTLAAFEFGIRRFNLLRQLFGLKPRKSETTAVRLAAQSFS